MPLAEARGEVTVQDARAGLKQEVRPAPGPLHLLPFREALRARAKLIVLAPRTLMDHLSDDADVLGGSRLLKRYVEQFFHKCEALGLGYLQEGEVEEKVGELRWHGTN